MWCINIYPFFFSYQERKQYEVGCKFTWNIDSNQYRITNVLPLIEAKPKLHKRYIWNPTKLMAPQMREKIQQPYAHTVRFLQNVMAFAGMYNYIFIYAYILVTNYYTNDHRSLQDVLKKKR